MASMHGLHLIADLRDCPVDRPEMTDADALRAACLAAVDAAGLHPVGSLFHPFTTALERGESAVFGTKFGARTGSNDGPGVGPGANTRPGTSTSTSTGTSTSACASVHGPGITGVVLLAESHLAVHTWPELGAVTLDTYVCNVGADNSARAHALMTALIALFSPGRIERQAVERGRLAEPLA